MNLSETLCFSGHRSYTGAADDETRLARALEAAWTDGYRTFISGMAPGFDLAAAEAVVRLRSGKCGESGKCEEHGGSGKCGECGECGPSPRDAKCSGIKLVAAIPFAAQAAGYSAVDRARYDALLSAADQVTVLEERYSHGCYYRRDEWMVNRSGRIICWFDPSGASEISGRKAGGTRYTVRRALKSGLEIINLFRPSDELF
jgi:uncharacterized phage-like protein YoqJ